MKPRLWNSKVYYYLNPWGLEALLDGKEVNRW